MRVSRRSCPAPLPGCDLKGRLLGLVVGLVGKRLLAKAFAKTVKAIETRNAAPN